MTRRRSRGVERAGRVYRALLALYPPAMRRHGADEMIAAFEARLEERLERAGPLGGLGHLVRTALDLAWNVPAAWADTFSPATLRDELTHAFRSLARDPALTASLVPTLAIGIGAVTAFFSIVNAQLFRPMPYTDSERLVALEAWAPGFLARRVPATILEPLRADVTAFDAVGAYVATSFNLGSDSGTDSYRGARLDHVALSALGVAPLLGRLPTRDDLHTGSEVGVLLGHRVWREVFGADPAIVGRRVHFEGAEVPVLGVMPEGFVFPEWGEIWAPFSAASSDQRSDQVSTVVRLAPGVGRARAEAELRGLVPGLIEQGLLPAEARLVMMEDLFNRGRGLAFLPWLLIGTGLAVLAVVCSNVASALLARATRRQGEIAVRRALGASSGRLMVGVLAEGAMLATLAGVLGLLVADVGLGLFLAGLGARFPVWFQPTLDLRVALFTFGAVTLSLLLFALPAALHTARGGLRDTMASAGVGATRTRRARRLRGALIAVQVALSLMLVVGGALFATSASRLATMDPGFDRERAWELAFGLTDEMAGDPERRTVFVQDVLERAGALPMVDEVASHGSVWGLRSHPQLTRDSLHAHPIEADGATARPVLVAASPGYFDASGLGLARGRDFGPGDGLGDALVAIASETLARRLWPEGDALGRSVRLGGSHGVRARVVGVARDERSLAGGGPGGRVMYARPVEHLYLSDAQAWAGTSPRVVIRVRPGGGSIDEADLVPAVRAAVQDADPHQAVASFERIAASAEDTRRAFGLIAALLVGLAAVGAGLAVLGVWGLIARSVAERQREIGVRTALGGSTHRIVAGVMASGVSMTLVGVLAGLVLAALVAPLVGGFLYEIDPLDPLVLVGSALTFLAVGAFAAWLPARHAARVDPVDALRVD